MLDYKKLEGINSEIEEMFPSLQGINLTGEDYFRLFILLYSKLSKGDKK